ncbi:MAG: transposase [Salinibacter sp.]
MDKAYDAEDTDELLDELGYTGHVKRQNRSEENSEEDSETGSADQQNSEAGIGEPVYPPRRWKVERSISWTNNMRKLRTRWAKTAANYRGLWLLGIALIIYRRIILG